jgi:hypothetical protein
MLHDLQPENEDVIQKSYEQTSNNFRDWSFRFCKLRLTPDQVSKLREELKVMKKALWNLLETPLQELRGEGLVVKEGIHENYIPNSEASKNIRGGIQVASLESVSRLEKIRELLVKKNVVIRFRTNGIIEQGYELMKHLLIDLQKFQIFPEKDLSFFLNQNRNGHLILAHAINKFHKSDLSMGFFFPDLKDSESHTRQLQAIKTRKLKAKQTRNLNAKQTRNLKAIQIAGLLNSELRF